MAEMGAAQKAVVFTESRRTQQYLKSFLEANGYSGRILTFNGTNSEPEATAIYQRWVEANRESGRATGSRVVDIRTALIEHFRDEAQIMIATEAAAEGINLQFCSLVVNYDLPWNPQRIEQRIGRCHRYGQRHDVVVINFLNQRNAADLRVYEILEEKFNLFNGVFGASDEVLGSIESVWTSSAVSLTSIRSAAARRRSRRLLQPCGRSWMNAYKTGWPRPDSSCWSTSTKTSTRGCG
jgi:superfamily II DNA/RNA helicase